MPPTGAGNPVGPGARTAIQPRPRTGGQTKPGRREPRRAAAVAGWAALAAMAVAQVVSSRAGHLEIFVTLIVVALAVASVSFTAVVWGWPRAGSAAAAAFALGMAAEWAGTRTGFPFGAYRYTGLLRPAAGTVPLVVPLAWAAMGLPGYAVGATLARSAAGRIAAGAVALTAWDLFLDPQMIRSGFWRWAHPGPYQGVPLSNFAGWLLVSAVLMAVFDVLLRTVPGPAVPDLARPGPGSRSPGTTADNENLPGAARHLLRHGRDGNGGVRGHLPARAGHRGGRCARHGHPGHAGLGQPYPPPAPATRNQTGGLQRHE